MQAIQSSLFPACLATEAWRSWQQGLLIQSPQNPVAGFVVAALATYCVAEKSGDSDEIVNSLQELGRRLYAYSAEPQLVAEIGETLTQAAGGRFQLKCAKIGEPTSNYMSHRPGLASVQRVQNWAVFKSLGDGQNVLAVKASVA